MKKITAFILSITLATFSFAQPLYPTQSQEEKTYPVGSFNSVFVSDNFELTLQEGACQVKVNADKTLMPYIQVYVREGILYIKMDKPSIPLEVKKIYRGRNAQIPVTRAIVTLPSIYCLSVNDKASVSGNGVLTTDSIKIQINDKALIRDLKLEANKADIKLNKSAQADISLQANHAHIKAGGFAQCNLTYKGADIQTDLSGNAKCLLNGESESLAIQTERMSRLDGLQFKVPRVRADMKGGSEAQIRAEEILTVHLTGGSALYYTGFPTIQVDEIHRSTLAPYTQDNNE